MEMRISDWSSDGVSSERCAAHRTTALGGTFEIATVASAAALLERCRHGSPGRAGKSADAGRSGPRNAGRDRRGLKEEYRPKEDVDRKQDSADRHVRSAFEIGRAHV